MEGPRKGTQLNLRDKEVGSEEAVAKLRCKGLEERGEEGEKGERNSA